MHFATAAAALDLPLLLPMVVASSSSFKRRALERWRWLLESRREGGRRWREESGWKKEGRMLMGGLDPLFSRVDHYFFH